MFFFRFFWICIFIWMACLTNISLVNLLDVWINNPTVMFIENTESAIENIPFPKITICPIDQMPKSVWEKYENSNTTYW